MKKLFVALFGLMLSLFSISSFALDQVTTIPQAVPYTYNGVTYDTVVVFGYPNMICNSVQAYYLVSSDFSDNPSWASNGAGIGCDYSRPKIYFAPYDRVAAFNAVDVGGGQCGWNSTPNSVVTFSSSGATINLDAKVDRAVFYSSIDLYWRDKNSFTFPFTFGSIWTSYGYVPSDGTLFYSTGPEETRLQFPLTNVTPYTAPVSAVMDHSMAVPYNEDGVVEAFNGEEGRVEYGCECYAEDGSRWFCNSQNYMSCDGVLGYQKQDQTLFLDGLIEYADDHLYYDGHPGYDYPEAENINIYTSQSGTLCVATAHEQARVPADVWRDPVECGDVPDVVITTWEGYHTFYIFHDDLYINGEEGDYMTVFLHNDDLLGTVRATIENNSFATVSVGDVVALVGGYGPEGSDHFADHVHMEVYKWNGVSQEWDRVDPYGDGTNNILWE
ncbi:MAG: hypothetical protein KC736_04225 [Candidatus Moranbacteria bacterium]|nr:hypothetical protein [Candidatus Moranbacteria bacterium]